MLKKQFNQTCLSSLLRKNINISDLSIDTNNSIYEFDNFWVLENLYSNGDKSNRRLNNY